MKNWIPAGDLWCLSTCRKVWRKGDAAGPSPRYLQGRCDAFGAWEVYGVREGGGTCRI